MDEFEIPEGAKFCVCDGCGAATPFGPSNEACRMMARTHGWATDVGPLSEDFCDDCVERGLVPSAE